MPNDAMKFICETSTIVGLPRATVAPRNFVSTLPTPIMSSMPTSATRQRISRFNQLQFHLSASRSQRLGRLGVSFASAPNRSNNDPDRPIHDCQ